MSTTEPTPPLSTMDGSDNPTPPRPDPHELWFDDGNVVFCVGKRKFRVYKGILATQSKKFSEMLTSTDHTEAGTSASGTENVDVAVITLKDDDADDVLHLFSAIFKPSYYKPPPSRYPLVLTLSIMRLAHKYDVPFLIQRALLHMDSLYPSNRDDLVNTSIKMRKSLAARDTCTWDPKDVLKHCLEVITFAYRADAAFLVPRVVYYLVRVFELNYILDHPAFPYQTMYQRHVIVQSSVACALGLGQLNGWVGTLPCADCTDEKACAYVSRTVQEQESSRIRTALVPPGRNQNQNQNVMELELELDVNLTVVSRKGGGDGNGNGDGNNRMRFCQKCQAAGKKRRRELWDAFWDRHAGICGFKDWEEVNSARSKALVALASG